MEQYKKPIMNIVELEKVDVLTTSGRCGTCDTWVEDLEHHSCSGTEADPTFVE
jgi:hypothetical protein